MNFSNLGINENIVKTLKNNGIKITGKTSSYGIMHYVSQFLPWIVFLKREEGRR